MTIPQDNNHLSDSDSNHQSANEATSPPASFATLDACQSLSETERNAFHSFMLMIFTARLKNQRSKANESDLH